NLVQRAAVNPVQELVRAAVERLAQLERPRRRRVSVRARTGVRLELFEVSAPLLVNGGRIAQKICVQAFHEGQIHIRRPLYTLCHSICRSARDTLTPLIIRPPEPSGIKRSRGGSS